MNTRLPVEHAVTEMVAGVDLVQAQFRVAGGERLPWTQSSWPSAATPSNAAYAEDPTEAFLPQAGKLLLYREPKGPGIRVDSGVIEGDEIGVNYDPLMAADCVRRDPRCGARACSVCTAVLPVLGIRTNIPFMLRLLEHPEVRRGAVHTGFIADHYAELTTIAPPPLEAVAAAGLAHRRALTPAGGGGHRAGMGDVGAAAARDPWSTPAGLGRR